MATSASESTGFRTDLATAAAVAAAAADEAEQLLLQAPRRGGGEGGGGGSTVEEGGGKTAEAADSRGSRDVCLRDAVHAGTSEVHKRYFTDPFFLSMFRGEVDPKYLPAFFMNMLVIYRALEMTEEHISRSRLSTSVFVKKELWRADALKKDVAHWEGDQSMTVSSASKFAAKIAVEGPKRPEWFAGVMYALYGGLISGGVRLRDALTKMEGVTREAGSAFYFFDAIPGGKAEAEAYKEATWYPALEALIAASSLDRRELNREVRAGGVYAMEVVLEIAQEMVATVDGEAASGGK